MSHWPHWLQCYSHYSRSNGVESKNHQSQHWLQFSWCLHVFTNRMCYGQCYDQSLAEAPAIPVVLPSSDECFKPPCKEKPMYIHLYSIHIYIYTYVYILMCICLYVYSIHTLYIYIYIYTLYFYLHKLVPPYMCTLFIPTYRPAQLHSLGSQGSHLNHIIIAFDRMRFRLRTKQIQDGPDVTGKI